MQFRFSPLVPIVECAYKQFTASPNTDLDLPCFNQNVLVFRMRKRRKSYGVAVSSNSPVKKDGERIVRLSLRRIAGWGLGRGDVDEDAVVAAGQARFAVGYSSFSSSTAVGVMVSSNSFSSRRMTIFASFPATSSANSLGRS